MMTDAERVAVALYEIDQRPTDRHPYEVHVAYDLIETGLGFAGHAEILTDLDDD